MSRRFVFAAGLALLCATPPVANAQMAGALGKPLPVSTMATGSVSVRVIAGAPDKPLIGISVQLVTPDGKALTARTDGEGRASFANLTPGARYVAKAVEPNDDESADGKLEGVSEQFAVPDTGGLRLMISTRPWQGAGGAAAPMAGGPMGAMDPRQMSGIPRGDPAVSAGSMTVAAVRDMVTNRLPDQTIHLIGYSFDGTVTRSSVKTNVDGRALFTDLQPRTYAYYALATFEREQGGADRLISDPVTMPPQVGIRMLLAGSPSGDSGPHIDDLAFLANQSERVQPGEILAQFWYRDQAQAPTEVTLYEIPETGAPVAVGTASLAPPTPAEVRADFSAGVAAPELAPGILSLVVLDTNQQMRPLPGISVQLVPITTAPADKAKAGVNPAEAAPAETAEPAAATADVAQPIEGVTDPTGRVEFTGLGVGRVYRLVLTIYQRRFESAPVLIPAESGIRAQATVAWRFDSSAEARFQNTVPGKIYFVQANYSGRPQLTRPFQMVADRGAVVGLPLYSKPLLSFHYVGWVDDEYLGFQGEMGLLNMSPAPWDPGSEGLDIPLPEGFVGGRVDDEVGERVKVAANKGLLWRDLMPPGRISFRLGFSLPVSDGSTKFGLNLPLGVFKGSIILVKSPGMELVGLPQQLTSIQRQARDGRNIFEISDISYQTDGRIEFKITGMPERPEAEQYIRLAVGVLVLVLLGWGLFQLFAPRKRDDHSVSNQGEAVSDKARLRKLSKRREEMLEQLVELESKKKRQEIGGEAYERARSKLQGRLETLFAEVEELEKLLGHSAA